MLIVGAGVAGLETLLALRAQAGALVDITIVSPETKFVNLSMAVNEPSKPRRRHGLPLKDIANDLSARWHRGAVHRVDTERRKVVTDDGTELAYDKLILAVGARFAHRGFIDTDAHGRVVGLEDVFAAGDATTYPIKQGGLAAQQADAVAEAIAASVDDTIDPQPLRPVLRGLLLTGGAARYLRTDVDTSSAESSVSELALWWPPNKLCGRYLAPYLSRQVGFAADVMPRGEPSIIVETALNAGGPGAVPALPELRDLPGDVSGVDDEDRDLRRLKDTVADAPEQ